MRPEKGGAKISEPCPDSQVLVYQQNKPKVLVALKEGEIDYAELTSWSFMDMFFAFLFRLNFLRSIAERYPSPREREGIPLWFLIAAHLQLRLHREKAYSNTEYVLRSGSMLRQVGWNLGERTTGIQQEEPRTPYRPRGF